MLHPPPLLLPQLSERQEKASSKPNSSSRTTGKSKQQALQLINNNCSCFQYNTTLNINTAPYTANTA